MTNTLTPDADSAGAQRPPVICRPKSDVRNRKQYDHSRGRTRQPLSKWTASQNIKNYSDECGQKNTMLHNQCTQNTHRLDLRALKHIRNMEPSEIIMKLAAPGSGLKELLNRPVGETTDSLTSITLDVLSKACSSRTKRQNLHHLLVELKESQFVKSSLPMLIMDLSSTKNLEIMDETITKLNKVLNLYLTLVKMFPSTAVTDVSLAVPLLETLITQLNVPEETDRKLNNLLKMTAHLKEKKREGTLRSDNYNILMEDNDASDAEDFRFMSIVPTFEDIHMTSRPYLRPNIVKDRFEDSNTYLETHFCLLREDFVRPLRDGISHLLKFDQGDLNKTQSHDIRVYVNAHITSLVCTPKGILYKIQFDNTRLTGVNWESSKRLLYGALVCLSMDSFETLIFATVAHRDPKELSTGIVTVYFDEENRQKLANVSKTKEFLMVETTAFFEAYRHVLQGLQELSAEDLPMQKYIIDCETDISPPKYLKANYSAYSLQSLMNDCPLKQKLKVSGLEKFLQRNRRVRASREADLRESVAQRGLKNILNLDDWPSKEELQLDASQMKAVQLALTKELAIIQGPPGTGKTHVGLKIVKALLDNVHVWGSALGSPILVVCYTNHALDQFLEGITKCLEKPSGLVRVGGRSCSDVIKKLSLSNLRKESNFTQKLPGHLRAMHCMLRDDMQNISDEIEKAAALLESSKKGILNDVVLEDYIFSIHRRSLKDWTLSRSLTPDEMKMPVMLEWLGVSALNFQRAAGENDDDGASPGEGLMMEAPYLTVAAPEEEEEEEGGMDAAGEAELEEAERMMDVDDMQKHIKRADNRLAMTQKQGLVYVLEEDGGTEERKKEVNEDGWQITSDMKKKLSQAVKRELQETECMLEKEALRVTDLWALSKKQRWSLYRLWLFKYQADIKSRILRLENKYQEIINRLEELRNIEDESLLRKARVIGMTSTCAARYRKVLHAIQPRIVVVEEAAEVLEAHVVTALTSGCQNLILIGDHQQLKPSTTIYDLAKNFNLDVSLFERLIGMNVPYVRLDYQHRMRPEIARLLSPYIYDKLENHASVYEYENIKGVTTNVFFVEHEHLEESIVEGHSHQNMHEATFVKSLCKYLICQGYSPSQITVLTTYTGQLLCLKKIMSNESKRTPINLCVVDRYQGEENDIIILSLVRSNQEGKVGFLKISNRICVALSRAKKGLFCIGNMSMLSSVTLWNKIIEELKCHGQIGKALSLRCENHPNTITTVSKAEDFAKVPQGGCSLPCEYQLNCGHVCTKHCHPTDADHKLFQCMKACKTICPVGHPCPKPCSSPCEKCNVLVTKTIPKCGHEQQVPCSDPAEEFLCRAPCNKTLSCGHSCVRNCEETCTRRCPQRVTVDLVCGHQKVMLCHDKEEADKNPVKLRCWVKCDAKLDCGHTCSGTCFQCNNGTAHIPCAAPCKVQLICLDYCKGRCGNSCVPCTEHCKNWCTHQTCQNPCSEPCQPCTKACEWRCQHHRCTLLCYEPCDRQPCHMPCLKQLPCQHQCIGMCGEPCPDKCRICNAEEVQEIFFGNEMDPEARFVQMSDCGHIFEVTGFDQVMMLPEKIGVLKQKCCPKCKTVIHRSVRYGAFVKEQRLEMEMLKGKSAVLYSQRIQSHVKEREQKGIQSSFIPPLLSKLASPSTGLAEAMLINRKIELLSQLAEIKQNTAELSEALRALIGREADLCGTKITEAEGYLEPEFERETKRIWFLAETRAFSEKYLQSESVISTFFQEHSLLNEILSKLSESGNALKEQDFRWIQTSVDNIAEKLDASIRWTMLDRTQYTDIDCPFLKLKHWSKCSKGHMYYTQPTENVNEMVQCPECSAE